MIWFHLRIQEFQTGGGVEYWGLVWYPFLQMFVVSGVFFVFCLMSHSRKFSIHGEERHFCGKGLQNFVGCPAFTIFDQGGIFIVPHMYSNGASAFMLSFEGLPLLDALYIKQGVLRIYCNVDPKGLFVVSTKNEINIVNIACWLQLYVRLAVKFYKISKQCKIFQTDFECSLGPGIYRFCIRCVIEYA